MMNFSFSRQPSHFIFSWQPLLVHVAEGAVHEGANGFRRGGHKAQLGAADAPALRI
jgi:hypothetical protein